MSNTKKIIDFCHLYKINTVYLQPHPNLGHRIESKKNDLLLTISILKNAKITVHLIGAAPIKKLFSFLYKKRKTLESSKQLSVKYALTDISAMEVQFLSKGIPCGVFIERETLRTLTIPRELKAHYKDRFIYNEENSLIKCPPLTKKHYYYFFSYPQGMDECTPLNKRVHWLCAYTEKELTLKKKQLLEKY